MGDRVSKDDAVTFVNPGGSTIKLAVNVNGATGRSITARFALINKVALAPVGDATMRDGTYGDTNFGTAKTMTVKEDAVNFARRSILKFDLSSIAGTITSAKLTLTPTAEGSAPGMVHQLYRTADSWSESSVTWNGMPVDGAQLTSWSVPAINTPVGLDLTGAANSVMAGSKVLSMKLKAAANYGAQGAVDYASREHAVPAYRPTLVVTYQ